MAAMENLELTYRMIEILKHEPALGNGSYGVVYRARCDELSCAAKVLHSTFFHDVDDDNYLGAETGHTRIMDRFHQECQFLSALKHPNIVQYLGTCHDSESDLPVLLMELMDESLTHYLEQPRVSLPYHVQVDLSYDVALALAYLHSNHIVHRDLSSNNVLLLANKRAKVSDFGVSKLIEPNALRRHSQLHGTMCPGTPPYMPPEVTDEAHPQEYMYTEKLDCFSYGVLCVQIKTRLFPEPTSRYINFQEPFPHLAVRSEIERRRNHLDQINPDDPMMPLIVECLNNEERDRPSSQEICHRLVLLKDGPLYTESVRLSQEGANVPIQDVDMDRVRRDEQRIRQLQRQLDEQTRRAQLLQNRLEEQDDDHRREISSKNHQIEQKNVTIAQKEQEIERCTADLERMNRELQERARRYENNREELRRCRDEVGELQVSVERKEAIIQTLQQQNDELREELRNKDYHLEQQREAVHKIANIKFSWCDGVKAPSDIRREPDATMDGNIIYFKCFWGRHILAYDITCMEWSRLPDCPNSSFSLAVINGHLTAIGGKQPDLAPSNTLLSLTGNEWKEMFPRMPTKRYWTIAAKFHTSIVVSGGEGEGRSILRTVEVLNTESFQWFVASSLPRPLDSASATICSDCLYIAGGSTRDTERLIVTCSLPDLLDTCRPAPDHELYAGMPFAQDSSVWNSIANLPLTKSTCTALDGHLLAVGGKDSDNQPSSAVFAYNSVRDTWLVVSHMNTARSSCFAVTLPDSNQLMITGGIKDKEGHATSLTEYGTLIT